jgi:hypothetical protein
MTETNIDVSKASKVQDEAKNVELDRLAKLVEAQIGNVLGGGYSEYGAYHKSDAN